MKGVNQQAQSAPDRSGERGYALLLVFALAAAIAISFYMALPRTTFESQRAKEQMLIDRGQQYVIAIRRFYRQFQRFPSTLDDLESTNNMRFLRKRYKDPMTGKAEWRLIHAGPGGVLIDSINQKAGAFPGQNGNAGQPGTPGQNAGFGQGSGFGQNSGQNQTSDNSPQPDGTPEVLNPGLQRRPSDRIPGAPMPGAQDPNQLATNIDPSQPFPQPLPGVDPSTISSINSSLNGLNQPGANYPPGLNPTSGSQMSNNQPGINQTGINQPGVNQPGMYPPGGMNPQGVNPAIGQPGNYPSGGPQTNQPFSSAQTPSNNSALSQVQGQIFGPSAQTPTNNSPFSNGPAVGGLVGVASKVSERGIKQINKKRKYSEWEFYLDLKKQNGLSTGAPVQGGPQVPGQTGGLPGNTTPPGGPGLNGGPGSLGGSPGVQPPPSQPFPPSPPPPTN